MADNSFLESMASSVASSAINGLVSYGLNNQTLSANKAMQQSQNEWLEAQVDKANEYNSAYSQVQRLRAAGLNVGSALGTNSAGNSTPASTGSLSSPNFANGIGMLPDLGAQYLQAKQVDSLRKLQDAQAKNTITATEGMKIDNKYKDVLSQQQIRSIEAATNYTNAGIVNMQVLADLKGKEVVIQEMLANLQSRHQDNEDRSTDANISHLQNQDAIGFMNAASNRMNAASNQLNASAAMLNANTQSRLADQSIEESKQRTEGLRLNNEYLDKTMATRIAQAIIEKKSANLDLKFKINTQSEREELVSGQVQFQNGQIFSINLDNEYKDKTMEARIYNEYCNSVRNTIETITSAAKGGAFMATLGM